LPSILAVKRDVKRGVKKVVKRTVKRTVKRAGQGVWPKVNWRLPDQ